MLDDLSSSGEISKRERDDLLYQAALRRSSGVDAGNMAEPNQHAVKSHGQWQQQCRSRKELQESLEAAKKKMERK